MNFGRCSSKAPSFLFKADAVKHRFVSLGVVLALTLAAAIHARAQNAWVRCTAAVGSRIRKW